jgi:hypothetical protein
MKQAMNLVGAKIEQCGGVSRYALGNVICAAARGPLLSEAPTTFTDAEG